MSVPRSMLDYMEDLCIRQTEEVPLVYRSRARVGRGGRIVMDRVPVSHAWTTSIDVM